MHPDCGSTEAIVRRHLQAFVEQQGLEAILRDYADDACFLSEGRAYCGKADIRGFFREFLGALPARAIGQFSLRSLLVRGDVAQITWSAGTDLPLGTDTFVVRDGRIVAQTFAMFAMPAG
ncbi:MAG: nuclear transport factor 2 family protein [Proteobacteria bacterium]|nr:nuclear transport factor 2 family protein [Pseudomonadota bacterium]